ncbi:Dsf2p [Sugiyamaella lignohabitans]|uniref:Dsf2p n=1 Tax=Sugiyamaella lignohabitans TaxID=796027 RepID=A0A167E373_9ASCO|nr:Dsf2p [Sugiyamaella lignohabitans]ANB13582.1 Dsf2p [Sugiyamaella lignohabitans]
MDLSWSSHQTDPGRVSARSKGYELKKTTELGVQGNTASDVDTAPYYEGSHLNRHGQSKTNNDTIRIVDNPMESENTRLSLQPFHGSEDVGKIGGAGSDSGRADPTTPRSPIHSQQNYQKCTVNYDYSRHLTANPSSNPNITSEGDYSYRHSRSASRSPQRRPIGSSKPSSGSTSPARPDGYIPYSLNRDYNSESSVLMVNGDPYHSSRSDRDRLVGQMSQLEVDTTSRSNSRPTVPPIITQTDMSLSSSPPKLLSPYPLSRPYQLSPATSPVTSNISSPVQSPLLETSPNSKPSISPGSTGHLSPRPVTPDNTKESKRRSLLRAISPLRRHHHKSEENKHGSDADSYDLESNEQEWEEKANELALSSSSLPRERFDFEKPLANTNYNSKNSRENELKLQKAINIHEQGRVEESCKLFEALARTQQEGGPGMPLAQLLYGLSLRHGWGCGVDEQLGFKYLRMAASASAELNQTNNTASTKAELVLAIFELGNSFRNGWGCEKDDSSAKTYYETAARLGDPDAMMEVAQCYLDGIGTKKNKHLAAKYYRMAEKHGRSEVGNSWIW